MKNKIETVIARQEELNKLLADPEVMNDTAWEMGVMTSVDGSNPFEEAKEVKPSPTPVVEKKMEAQINLDKLYNEDIVKAQLTEREVVTKNRELINRSFQLKDMSPITELRVNNNLDIEKFKQEITRYYRIEKEMGVK